MSLWYLHNALIKIHSQTVKFVYDIKRTKRTKRLFRLKHYKLIVIHTKKHSMTLNVTSEQ